MDRHVPVVAFPDRGLEKVDDEGIGSVEHKFEPSARKARDLADARHRREAFARCQSTGIALAGRDSLLANSRGDLKHDPTMAGMRIREVRGHGVGV